MGDSSGMATATGDAVAYGPGHPESESDHRGDPGPRPLRKRALETAPNALDKSRAFAIGDRIVWRMSKGKSPHPGKIVSRSEKGYDWRLKIDVYEIEIHAFEQELEHESILP